MKRTSLKPYLLLFSAAFLLLSLSPPLANQCRGAFVAAFGPAWNALSQTRLGSFGVLSSFSQPASSGANHDELELLRLENRLLKNELKRLREHFGNDLGYIFYMDFDIIPAKVIFRSPATWDSSLWINVGKTTNAQLGRAVVAPNSPVVVNKSVVGVVDYVGENQSRVRLITDSGLVPAVRAVRTQGGTAHHLAKGELHGSSGPLWRTHGHRLRGIGFNYDFPDEKGGARDLSSGKPLDGPGEALPLIQPNDLLVTTGLDGVFPPGLQAARVTTVFPLQEGDYYYELEANPTAGNLDELVYLFVLKPVGFESEDQPAGGW